MNIHQFGFFNSPALYVLSEPIHLWSALAFHLHLILYFHSRGTQAMKEYWVARVYQQKANFGTKRKKINSVWGAFAALLVKESKHQVNPYEWFSHLKDCIAPS